MHSPKKEICPSLRRLAPKHMGKPMMSTCIRTLRSSGVAVSRREKQREDHFFVREFSEFVSSDDPTVLRMITAVSETGTHEDAAGRLGVSNYEYFRMHARLRQLAESFVSGAEVTHPRRRYQRRVKRTVQQTQ